MLCRLCLNDDSCQDLGGEVCDMLRAVLRKNCIQISSPVGICSSCAKKVKLAYDFKTTCLRTQKILSVYGGSRNRVVYLKENKLRISPKNYASPAKQKLCTTCLKLIENGICYSLSAKYDVLQILTMYIPEMVVSDTESSVICYKCSDHFRIFADIINTTNKTESMITNYFNENHVRNVEDITLADIVVKREPDNSPEEKNIMKLLGDKEHFLLDLEYEFESTYLSDNVEESEKRIIKKIIEEDVDLFYKEKPDFDSNDALSEESSMNSDHGNVFLGFKPRQLLLSDPDGLQQKRIRESIEEDETSLRLSFETEESSLSPGNLSDRHFYESESQDETKKDDERDITSPNPFIFFNNYEREEDRCVCDQTDDVSQPKTKRKRCEKCQWKKALGYSSEDHSSIRSEQDLVQRANRAKKEGKKCRKAYGIEFKDMWCTQCRWKKACTRFGAAAMPGRR